MPFCYFLTKFVANLLVHQKEQPTFILEIMTVADYIKQQETDEHRFSFEVLPPLKGNGTDALFRTIDKLAEFNPAFINITTHHSEYVYKELDNGQFERQRIRRRPGTIAIASAIKQRYNIPVEPHVICSGTTIEQIEYELLDLQFLGPLEDMRIPQT